MPASLKLETKGLLKDLGIELSKSKVPSCFQVVDIDYGRAEEVGVDLVKVVIVLLENFNKWSAIIVGGRAGDFLADLLNRSIFYLNPERDFTAI